MIINSVINGTSGGGSTMYGAPVNAFIGPLENSWWVHNYCLVTLAFLEITKEKGLL